jgi:hypothetical protein
MGIGGEVIAFLHKRFISKVLNGRTYEKKIGSRGK